MKISFKSTSKRGIKFVLHVNLNTQNHPKLPQITYNRTYHIIEPIIYNIRKFREYFVQFVRILLNFE